MIKFGEYDSIMLQLRIIFLFRMTRNLKKIECKRVTTKDGSDIRSMYKVSVIA